MDDPFKNTIESKAEKPKKEKNLSDDVTVSTEQDENGQLSATIRLGASYDAPMVNLKTATADEVNSVLDSDAFKRTVNLLYGVWQGVRKKTADLELEKAPEGASKPLGGGQKPKRPNPPGTPSISCEHGERSYFTKNGWEALFCPHDEKSEQCPPLFKQKNGQYEENMKR